MANIQVKIQLQDTVEDTITSMGSPSQSNNASIYKADNVFASVSTKNDGRNMKSWAKGYLSLKDGYVGGKDTKLVAQYGYNGYVFGAVPESKQLEVTIEVIGENIDSIIVYGDKEANQFPTKAYKDSNPNDIIYSDDPNWAIKFDNPATSHTITFLEWNRAEYNACITSVVEIKNELVLGNEYIKNIESLSQSTDRPDELFYGVIPSSGSVELIDRDGELKEYITDGIIENSNLPIEIKCNGKTVHKHITTDSDYSANVLSMQFEDELAKWENMQYGGYAYPKHSETAYNMLVDVLRSIGYDKDNETNEEIDEMLDTEIIYDIDNKVGKVSDYLKIITIPYPYLESASVRATIDKFCVLAQLQVLLNDEGKIKFVSARPRATESELENTIPFGKNRIFGTIENSIIIKNKYEAVEMNETKVNDEIEYNELCYSYNEDLQTQTFDYENDKSDMFTQVGSLYGYIYVYSCILLKYKDFSFAIPKMSNNGLNEILDMKNGTDINGNPYINYSITYRKKEGIASTNKSSAQTLITPSNTDRDYEGSKYSDAITGNLSNSFTYSYTRYGIDVESTSTATDYSTNKTAEYRESEDGKYYLIDLRLLIAKEEFGTSATNNGQMTQYKNVSGKAIRYDIFKMDISFNGDKKTISFEDISASDSNIAQAKTFAHIDNSELLQENAKVGDEKISTIIKTNIKKDYANGITTSKITIPCVDYYNEYGNLEKDFAKGEIANVGDIARVVKNERIRQKTTGRTFRKQGVPMIDLELQEINENFDN